MNTQICNVQKDMKRIDCFKVLIESEIVPVIGNSQATLSSWLLRELIDEI